MPALLALFSTCDQSRVESMLGELMPRTGRMEAMLERLVDMMVKEENEPNAAVIGRNGNKEGPVHGCNSVVPAADAAAIINIRSDIGADGTDGGSGGGKITTVTSDISIPIAMASKDAFTQTEQDDEVLLSGSGKIATVPVRIVTPSSAVSDAFTRTKHEEGNILEVVQKEGRQGFEGEPILVDVVGETSGVMEDMKGREMEERGNGDGDGRREDGSSSGGATPQRDREMSGEISKCPIELRGASCTSGESVGLSKCNNGKDKDDGGEEEWRKERGKQENAKAGIAFHDEILTVMDDEMLAAMMGRGEEAMVKGGGCLEIDTGCGSVSSSSYSVNTTRHDEDMCKKDFGGSTELGQDFPMTGRPTALTGDGDEGEWEECVKTINGTPQEAEKISRAVFGVEMLAAMVKEVEEETATAVMGVVTDISIEDPEETLVLPRVNFIFSFSFFS